jgi:hypothetical protein
MVPVVSSRSRSIFQSLTRLIAAVNLKEATALADQADEMEATHGDHAVEAVRAKILDANRSARRRLYHLHDELSRRRRDPEPSFAEMGGV